jgi:hypothetical protein
MYKNNNQFFYKNSIVSDYIEKEFSTRLDLKVKIFNPSDIKL